MLRHPESDAQCWRKTEYRRRILSALRAWIELGERPCPPPIALRRSVARSFKNVAQQVGAYSSNAMIEEVKR